MLMLVEWHFIHLVGWLPCLDISTVKAHLCNQGGSIAFSVQTSQPHIGSGQQT